MIGSCELKARVEESLGTVLDPDFFGQAEQYARRKLDMCNERAGRIYGEDGYGDEYLVLLTADTVREMAFSAWCEIRNAEITAAREKPIRASRSVHSIIDAPIGRHSEKPAETRDRIAALAGGGRYDRTICQTGGPRLGRLGRRSAADRKRGKP